uniref:ORF61 n=1 Tax=Oryza sativa TaxID=4530 RepID=Q35295_ORYSA|nr:ORF61 [Oryza sativa Indica Group]
MQKDLSQSQIEEYQPKKQKQDLTSKEGTCCRSSTGKYKKRSPVHFIICGLYCLKVLLRGRI